MIRSLVFLILLPFMGYCQEAGKYVIHGVFPDGSLDGNFVTLRREHLDLEKGEFLLDSVRIEKGKFVFKGKAETVPFLAKIGTSDRCWGSVIVEKGKIRFVVSSPRCSGNVSGTSLNEVYNREIVVPWNNLMQADTLAERKEKAMAEKNWTELDEIDYRKVYPYELAEIVMDKQFTFIENHLQYPEVVLSALYSKYSSYLDRKKSGVNDADPFTHRLEEILPKVPQELMERMNKHYAEWEAFVKAYLQEHPSLMQKLTEESKLKEVVPPSAEVGCKYIDFQGLDLNGDTLKLSEIVSGKKLVLLDFWASWCAPCMKEMPVVDSLYRKYRSKGLEVIGISSDQDPAAWKKTISQRHMDWQQMREVKNIGDLYGIYFIPYTILLDSEGRIVARNLKGEDLRNEVEKYLGD